MGAVPAGCGGAARARQGLAARARVIGLLAGAAGTPREFLRSLTAALAASLQASDFSRGCPIATVALETATASSSLRSAADQQFSAWEQEIARGLAREAHPTAGDRELAAQILMLYEGALIMARVRRSTAPLLSLDAAFESLLAGRRPAAGRASRR